MRKLVIYGAGEAGIQLLSQIKKLPNQQYEVIGFVDEFKHQTIGGSYVEGLDVISFEAAVRFAPDTVVVAIPSLNVGARNRIIAKCQEISSNILFLPSVSEILNGSVRISDLRQEVSGYTEKSSIVYTFDEDVLSQYTGSNVLVTGGAGSIGSEIVKQLMSIPDCRVTIIDQSEYNLYKVTEDLHPFLGNRLEVILGSILDTELICSVFKKSKFDYVFHAAAYKHVPLIEINQVVGLKNNILGTKLLLEHALKAKVKNFLLVSTDKAVRPTNFMGASKRVCEQIVLQANTLTTQCNFVRFGNVLNSSGSVIPKFRQQILEGGPVTVTHPEITRFFMSIEQAVYLVISSIVFSEHRNLFVLDMGEPQKIVELAKRLIREHGFFPVFEKDVERNDAEILIKFTGLRPGEKLYEELVLGADLVPTEINGLLKGNEPRGISQPIDKLISILNNCPHDLNIHELVTAVKDACPEFISAQNE